MEQNRTAHMSDMASMHSRYQAAIQANRGHTR